MRTRRTINITFISAKIESKTFRSKVKAYFKLLIDSNLFNSIEF